MIVPLLHPYRHFTLLPLLCRGLESLWLELTIFEKLISRSDIRENVEATLWNVGAAQEMTRVVCEPFGRRAGAGAGLDVPVKGLFTPGHGGGVAVVSARCTATYQMGANADADL